MGKNTKRHRIPTTDIAGITIREIRPGYFQVDFMRDGIRTRKCFHAFEEAKTYALQKNAELRNRGTAALSLSDKLRVEVEEVIRRLNGRVTLTELADYWLQRNPDGSFETWEETSRRYLAAMAEHGRRAASTKDKEIKLNLLSAALGNPPTCSVDRPALEAAVKELGSSRNWSADTCAMYTGAGLTLCRFFRGEGKRMRMSDETPPATWDARFIASLFSKAEKITPSIVPALAVMTFAGLRPTEALRIGWDSINFEEGLISLAGADTKTRDSRHVTVTPNLRKWLLAYRGAGNLVATPARYRAEREKLMNALHVAEWPNDVLRHTAATFIYARTKSVDETCAELGHYGTAMFTRHYKGVAPMPADVKRFWSISPKRGERNEGASK